MEFSRQEYWSGLPFPSPGDLPDPGIKPGSPALQADSLPSELLTHSIKDEIGAHMLIPIVTEKNNGKNYSMDTARMWIWLDKKSGIWNQITLVCHSFPSKKQASSNFMAAFTICTDSGAQENIYHCFYPFPFYLPGNHATWWHDLKPFNVEFQASFFSFHMRNLDSILKSKDITLSAQVHMIKLWFFL